MPTPFSPAALPSSTMRASHFFAHGQALHVNTTSVPFAPLTSAIEISPPSAVFILVVAIGALAPRASDEAGAACAGTPMTTSSEATSRAARVFIRRSSSVSEQQRLHARLEARV